MLAHLRGEEGQAALRSKEGTVSLKAYRPRTFSGQSAYDRFAHPSRPPRAEPSYHEQTAAPTCRLRTTGRVPLTRRAGFPGPVRTLQLSSRPFGFACLVLSAAWSFWLCILFRILFRPLPAAVFSFLHSARCGALHGLRIELSGAHIDRYPAGPDNRTEMLGVVSALVSQAFRLVHSTTPGKKTRTVEPFQSRL